MLIVWTVSDELRRLDLLTAGGQKRADKLHHRGGMMVIPGQKKSGGEGGVGWGGVGEGRRRGNPFSSIMPGNSSIPQSKKSVS